MPTLREMRGEVIEHSATIETLMGCVVSRIYFGQVKDGFMHQLWTDEYCSFALKRNVLLKLAPELRSVKDFEQDLHRLGSLRNYFAHVAYAITGPDGENPRVPNPRDFRKSIDFPALYAEFLEKAKRVQDHLLQHFENLGGQIEYNGAPGPGAPPS